MPYFYIKFRRLLPTEKFFKINETPLETIWVRILNDEINEFT